MNKSNVRYIEETDLIQEEQEVNLFKKIEPKKMKLIKRKKKKKLDFIYIFTIFSRISKKFILKKFINTITNLKKIKDKISLKKLFKNKIIRTKLYHSKYVRRNRIVKLKKNSTDIAVINDQTRFYSTDPIKYEIKNIINSNEMRNPVNSINLKISNKFRRSEDNVKISNNRYGNLPKTSTNYYENILKTLSNINNLLDINNCIEYGEEVPQKLSARTADGIGLFEKYKLPELSDEKWDEVSFLMKKEFDKQKELTPKIEYSKSQHNSEEDSEDSEDEEDQEYSESNSALGLQNILNKYNHELIKINNKKIDSTSDTEISTGRKKLSKSFDIEYSNKNLNKRFVNISVISSDISSRFKKYDSS